MPASHRSIHARSPRLAIALTLSLTTAVAVGRTSSDERDGRTRTPSPPTQESTQESPRALEDLLRSLDPELQPYPSEGDAGRVAAIERGLAWLASRQKSRNGSIEIDASDSGTSAPLAVTSLAALAWMSGGSSPTRGKYQKNVRRAIEYLLACTHGTTDDYPGYIEDRGDSISRTHGHGLATLALAHAYTVSPNTPLGKRIGNTLVLAVDRIMVSQGDKGGWEYHPYSSLQHEGSVTVALVQALRAANDVGIRVDPGVIADAVEYIRRIQVMEIEGPEDGGGTGASRRVQLGGFKYALDDDTTSIALTAAGLVTLQATGTYSGPRIDEGYDYIWRKLAVRAEEGAAAPDPFPYYERFYLSQALWHHRDTDHYRRWAEPIMREMIGSQGSKGQWQDVRKGAEGRAFVNRYGTAYATSCNVLFLALPDDTLPLFHR